ncbi:hypothetical protein UF75_1089 [Desulfosporosinus sp. I2]|nr:hypothetical protein UF75_1089 [Desulfosporosinus sp. I2]
MRNVQEEKYRGHTKVDYSSFLGWGIWFSVLVVLGDSTVLKRQQ